MKNIIQIVFLFLLVQANAQEEIIQKGEKWLDYSNANSFNRTIEIGYFKPISFTKDENTATLASETFSIDRSNMGDKIWFKVLFYYLGNKFINDDYKLKIIVETIKS